MARHDCRTSRKDAKDAGASQVPKNASSLLAIDATRQANAEISITTADGDTVTIGLHSEFDLSIASYRGPGQPGARGLRADSATATSTREIQISVQGDLSDQEMSDIKSLVQRLAQVIRGFLTGNGDASSDTGGDGAASSTIAGFSLHVDRSQSLTVMESSGAAAPATGDAAAASAAAPASAPMLYQVPATDASTDTAAAAPASTDAPATPAATPAATPNQIAATTLERMLDTVQQSNVDLARVGRALTRAIRHMLHDLSREPGLRHAAPSIREVTDRLPVQWERPEQA